MRIAKIGKVDYAFDLEWVDASVDQKPTDTLEDVRTGGPQKGLSYISVIATDKQSAVLGYGVAVGHSKQLCSYAATLALAGNDGVYIAPAEGERYWFATIRGGIVIPGTDRSGEPADILRAALAMRSALGMSMFCAPGVDHEAESFDLAASVANVRRPAAMRQAGQSRILIGAAFGVLLLGGAGVAGYSMLSSQPQPMAQANDQAEALARDAWVSSVSAATSGLAEDGNWASVALASVFRAYPPFIAGWRAEGSSCTPSGCDIRYALPDNAVSAITVMRERFGTTLSAPSPDGRSVSVHRQFDSAMRSFSADDVGSIGPVTRPIGDLVGLMPVSVPSATIDGTPETAHLTGTPTGLPALRVESVAIKSEQVDAASMQAALTYWQAGGFVPVTLAWSNGWGAVPAAWRIQFMRVTTES